jgi:DNA replication protein DnaC
MNCPEHGCPVETMFVCGIETYLCPICENEKESRIHDFEKKKDRDFSFIPERYREACFDNYDCKTDKQKKLVSFLKGYSGEKNVIISGPPGTGKTRLLWSLVRHNPRAEYYKASDVMRRIRYSFQNSGESEQGILNELSRKSILILDEIGKQQKTDFTVNFMFDLIDTRYSNNLHTVLCSNLPAMGEGSIKDYIGSAAMDRINENSIVINCDWENYRKTT